VVLLAGAHGKNAAGSHGSAPRHGCGLRVLERSAGNARSTAPSGPARQKRTNDKFMLTAVQFDYFYQVIRKTPECFLDIADQGLFQQGAFMKFRFSEVWRNICLRPFLQIYLHEKHAQDLNFLWIFHDFH
jgi:hypothetical protein